MARIEDVNLLRALRHEGALREYLGRYGPTAADLREWLLETYRRILMSAPRAFLDERDFREHCLELARATAEASAHSTPRPRGASSEPQRPPVHAGKGPDRAAVRVALDRLSPRARELIVLNREWGLTEQQIAERFGREARAVRVEMSAAICEYATVWLSLTDIARTSSPLGVRVDSLGEGS